MSGNPGAAREILNELEEQSKHKYVSAYAKAVIHLSLNDRRQAFACLEQAYDDRCEMVTWLKVDPHFDNLRGDPQFIDLLGRVGLLEHAPAEPSMRRPDYPSQESHL